MVNAQRDQAKILQQCARLIDDGQLKIHLAHTLPLEDAPEAHRLLETGSMMGKMALVMD